MWVGIRVYIWCFWNSVKSLSLSEPQKYSTEPEQLESHIYIKIICSFANYKSGMPGAHSLGQFWFLHVYIVDRRVHTHRYDNGILGMIIIIWVAQILFANVCCLFIFGYSWHMETSSVHTWLLILYGTFAEVAKAAAAGKVDRENEQVMYIIMNYFWWHWEVARKTTHQQIQMKNAMGISKYICMCSIYIYIHKHNTLLTQSIEIYIFISNKMRLTLY